MRRLALAVLMVLPGCAGIAWNTDVASTPASRLALALSVEPGRTTETGLVTRWGNPVQKVREGGQTEYIYRSILNPRPYTLPQFGDSDRYVIVTFQYGLATGVRTSDGIACRASFPPRPPGYGFDTPATVRLVGSCPLGSHWGEPGSVITDPVREDTYAPGGKAPRAAPG